MEPAPAEDTVAFNPKAARKRHPPSHLDMHFIEETQPSAQTLPLPPEPSDGMAQLRKGWSGWGSGSFSCEPLHPRCGICVLRRRAGEMSLRERLVCPAVQSGGWCSGRGAIFPVESWRDAKQTPIPAKPIMVYL